MRVGLFPLCCFVWLSSGAHVLKSSSARTHICWRDFFSGVCCLAQTMAERPDRSPCRTRGEKHLLFFFTFSRTMKLRPLNEIQPSVALFSQWHVFVNLNTPVNRDWWHCNARWSSTSPVDQSDKGTCYTCGKQNYQQETCPQNDSRVI